MLFRYFEHAQDWFYPFEYFGSDTFFYYLQFFKSIQTVTLNQYQQKSGKNNQAKPDSDRDLKEFLDHFHARMPEICGRLKLIRVFTLKYNAGAGQNYYEGKLLRTKRYPLSGSKSSKDLVNASAKCKFENLECFISVGNYDNLIFPRHIRYIANESKSSFVIDIDNMAPSLDPSAADRPFKDLFHKHNQLKVLRIRSPQRFECSTDASILPSDFETASMDQFEVLMIENMRAFIWNSEFLQSLLNRLSKKNFLYLYLTQEGCQINSFWGNNHWADFRKKFKFAVIQNKKLYHWTQVVRFKARILAVRNGQ